MPAQVKETVWIYRINEGNELGILEKKTTNEENYKQP